MVSGLAFSEHGRPSRQFFPKGEAVAHPLPLDELFGGVAVAVRGGNSCNDNPIPDVFGNAE